MSALPKAGFDVIEARSGDSAFGTWRGDILVAGYHANPAGNRDAFLVRTRAARRIGDKAGAPRGEETAFRRCP